MNKICFLIYQMDLVGGTERVIVNLASDFIKRMGVQISIIALEGEKCFLPLPSNVLFHTLHHIPFSKKPFALRKYLQDNQVDLLISAGMTRLNIWLSLILPLLHGTKVIATEHVNMTYSPYIMRLAKRVLFCNFDRFVLLTHDNELFYRKLGLKNVLTIPNSNSFDLIHNPEYLSRPKVILAIGRLEKQKNFMHLLFAWKCIFSKYPDWKLNIVGEGSMRDDMIDFINSNDMYDNCILLPFVNDVDRYYSNAQVFVMSSLFEGLPMVLLEAQQYGIPCVSYDCETGPRDVILDGENGLLSENQNYEDLAQKLSILLSNEDLRLDFHKKSLIYSLRFSKEAIWKQWANLFTDLFDK